MCVRAMRWRAACAASMGALTLAAGAHAEPCEAEWVSLGETGTISTLYAMATWDPDGDGPESPVLIAGGSVTYPGAIKGFNALRWTGERWEPLGQGPPIQVQSLGAWDPDGDGPANPVVVAGGVSGGVYTFDGATWAQLGAMQNGKVWRILTWDPDGDGPAGLQLVIGGDFTTIGGEPIAYIAAWDGSAWGPIGDPIPMPARALTVWDADGDGPNAPLLVAGSSKVRVFDGAMWSMLDATDDDGTSALAVWDEDGDGPNPPVLYGAGNFDTSSPTPMRYVVARWTGSGWEQVGVSPLVTSVRDLLVGDPDGPGPAPVGLVITADVFNRECFFWDGSVWSDWSSGIQSPLNAATFADPDGAGPAGVRLVVGGNSNPGAPASRDAWGWQKLGSGLLGTCGALARWDPDGPGPEPETVFAGGYLIRGTLLGLAMLRDGRWVQLGGGPAPSSSPSDSYAQYTLVPWRGGPSTHGGGVLVALAKNVPTSLGLPAGSIPMWNGEAWTSLSSPGDNSRFCVWDPDGDGPEAERLIAATSGDVLAHDGAAWTSLSTDATHVAGGAVVWDPDGDGPETARIISKAGSEYVWRTTGEWMPMPPAFGASISEFRVTDPDGDGPGAAWLIGAREISSGASTAQEIVRWNGASWESISAPIKLLGAYSFDVWDPDGPGPRAPQPIACSISIPNDPTPYDAVTYEDSAWRSVGTFDFDGYALWYVRAMLGLPHDIPGFPAGSLFIGGSFEQADGVRSLTTVALRACAAPVCAGDITGDGASSMADFLMLVTHFGSGPGATRADGDLTGDGVVNSADFNVLASDFGCVQQ